MDPGGGIVIHCQRNGYKGFSTFGQLFNPTDGCIALTNPDMDLIWRALNPCTPQKSAPDNPAGSTEKK